MTEATDLADQGTLHRNLSPGESIAIELDADQRLRIVDQEGQQITNLVCYNRHAPDEFLETAFSYSQIRNKDQQLSLYSDRGNPMLEATEDTVGVHNLRGDLCTSGEVEKRFDIEDPPNCQDALEDALSDYPLPDWLPFPAGIFKNVEESRNEYRMQPAASGSGDYIDFTSKMDLLVGLCVCPNEWDSRNGFSPSPVTVTVYENGGEDD